MNKKYKNYHSNIYDLSFKSIEYIIKNYYIHYTNLHKAKIIKP